MLGAAGADAAESQQRHAQQGGAGEIEGPARLLGGQA